MLAIDEPLLERVVDEVGAVLLGEVVVDRGEQAVARPVGIPLQVLEHVRRVAGEQRGGHLLAEALVRHDLVLDGDVRVELLELRADVLRELLAGGRTVGREAGRADAPRAGEI